MDNLVEARCYFVHKAPGLFIGDGSRVIKFVFCDGNKALIHSGNLELSTSTSNFSVDVITSKEFKLEKGRLKKKVGEAWVDMYPVERAARQPGDMSLTQFIRRRRKASVISPDELPEDTVTSSFFMDFDDW